ncbi:oligoribonuclease [Stylonychia lemnae]|uniref:Oligoribonuclease n=1 Tax=Stylonychia lemnae TaxID=5949 RepID=A0A078AJW3_STYLE|nr:oligoribonuclease [Stylonychia lemnae]|eukprot:CDW81752.1 oligoribonuclease [Stylonychia lemnae]
MEEQQSSYQAVELIDPLIWIDCEMTGLNLTKNQIIEIAVIVTDGSLDTMIEGPCLVVRCPESDLSTMDEWCTQHHTESGLVQQVRDSKITLQDAEQQILDFLQNTCNLKGFNAQLAGNSVGEDKRFLSKDMPRLHDFLHYRVVDVSTIYECMRRWLTPEDVPENKKITKHRALDDIKESIAQLKHYKTHIFDKVKTFNQSIKSQNLDERQ